LEVLLGAPRLPPFRGFPSPEEAPALPAIVFLDDLLLWTALLPLLLVETLPPEATLLLLDTLLLAALVSVWVLLAPFFALSVTIRAPSPSSNLINFLARAPCLVLWAIRPKG